MQMIQHSFRAAVLLCALAPPLHAADAPATHGAVPPDVPAALLEKYCAGCHNATDWAGGVAFDTMSFDTVRGDAAVWEEAVRKMRGRLMPPPGEPQPPQAALDQFVGWMEGRLDAESAGHSEPGFVGLHRLNRTEYAQAVEQLLGVRINAAALLPKDTRSDGFDNVANVLRVSPTFLDQYISAARTVSVMAVGEPNARAVVATYRAPPSRQAFHLEGLPLGTRGGMQVEHWFPADADYEFTLRVPVGGGYGAGMAEQTVVFLIDGKKVFEQNVGGELDSKAVDQLQAPANAKIAARFQKIRVPVTAGPHRLAATFVETSFAESEATLAPFTPGGGSDSLARVAAIDIAGPYGAKGVGQTPSRQRIFSCYPKAPAEEAACAREIVSRLAREAYRRPVDEADLAAPLRFYEEARATDGFESGIQSAIMAILSSPKFLYRIQKPAGPVQAGTAVFDLDDLSVATRLSFFLWSRGPDEELLSLATAGRLRDPVVLDAQVRRLLADPRAKALVSNFAQQWLNIDGLADVDPDPALFPSFDEDLRRAYVREIELFVDDVLRRDAPVTELLTSQDSFLNERLALHYGVPNVRGDQFRRVRLADPNRHGLLGKGGILMLTSYGNRTAPVLRGAWILERITGTPPAAPPPGVEALKENEPGGKQMTVRQRLEMHRAAPSCNACHGVMDPLGFALENFDAIGAWRTVDRQVGAPVDAGATMPGGFTLAGPADLRRYLLSRPDQFVQALTEKLMVYALGRTVEHHDMPQVRAIVRDARDQEYRFSALVRGIVRSDAFLKGRSEPIQKPEAEGAAATTVTRAD